MDRLIYRATNIISKVFNRQLDFYEIKEIKEFVKENTKYIKSSNENDILLKLSEEYIKSKREVLEGLEDKSALKDTDLSLLTEYNIVRFLGIESFDRLISEFNPKAKKKKAYMCLDSRYAKFNTDCTKLTWDFENSIQQGLNSTNVLGKIRNITEIRMQSIVVKKFNSVVMRSSILIEELSAQAFVLPNGRRFHFVGLLNDLQNPITTERRNEVIVGTFVPDFTIHDKYELLAGFKFNDGIFRFNKPITELSTITVSIGDPFDLVTIKKYEIEGVTIQFTNDFPFTVRLTFPEPHRYTEFYASIFIDDLVISPPSSPSWDAFINDLEHTYVTRIDDFTLDVQPDRNAAAGLRNFAVGAVAVFGPLPSDQDCSKVRVRFLSYRVIMNFELEYMLD